jgi:CO dehydrogenase maturation factor
VTTTIALAGKGGVGKTTFAALLIKYLVESGAGAILAIDADPSANLHLALGLPLAQTIGDIREEMLANVNKVDGSVSGHPGMTKFDYLDMQIEYALIEGDQIDLLAMGRPEGPGCYCAVNHILREIVDRLGRSYDYVIIDNEAGLEHLSRRTTRDVDLLYVITDPTVRGVVAAGRVGQLRNELDINIKEAWLVVNRVTSDHNGRRALSPALTQAIAGLEFPLAGTIPAEEAVNAADADGRPLVELGEDSTTYRAVRSIVQQTLPENAKGVAGSS